MRFFLDSVSDILENCLFIIWRHLEYYLLHCVPADQQPLAFQSVAHRQQQMRRLQGKVTTGGGRGDEELVPQATANEALAG